MLEHTFCHLPGIGPKTERNLWAKGILDWDDYIAMDGGKHLQRKPMVREALERSREELANGNAAYFAEALPSGEQWRLYHRFSDRVAYLDIETTGVGQGEDYITAIAVSNGSTVATYAHGRNLQQFEIDIEDYDLLVTFNGRCFDVPFIEREFGIALTKAHIDLRFVLRSVGMTGGLKKVEKQLGIDREELDGVDGYFAVLLWNEYLRTRSENVIETLLAYNAEDVIHLETLLVHAVNLRLQDTPFANDKKLHPRTTPANPHTPDEVIIEKLRSGYRPRY